MSVPVATVAVACANDVSKTAAHCLGAYLPTVRHRTLSRPIHGRAFRLYWTTKTKSMFMAMPMTKPNEKAKPRARAKKLSLGLRP